jgi:hypothetical protein
MKILFDKLKNKQVDKDFWIDNEGSIWINSNPYGVNMDSSVSIMRVNESQYELRDFICPNTHCNDGVVGVEFGEEQYCHICRDLIEETISIVRRV